MCRRLVEAGRESGVEDGLRMVNMEGQSVFSLAVSAFPNIPDYTLWLELVCEVYDISLSEAVIFPYDSMSSPPSYLCHSTTPSESDFRSIPTSLPFICYDNLIESDRKYIEHYREHREEQVCPIAVAASLPDSRLLLWLLERGDADLNWMSGGKPLWMHFQRYSVPVAAWKQLHSAYFLYRKGHGMNEYEVQLIIEEEMYRCTSWLWTCLSLPNARYPLLAYIQTLKQTYPTEYTDHYVNLLLQYYLYSYSNRRKPTVQTDYVVICQASEYLDCTARSYRLFLYRKIDVTIKSGQTDMLKQLLSLPSACEFVLSPRSLSLPLGLYSELSLSEVFSDFNENINVSFISNSYLYSALSRYECKFDMIQTLLDLGCPLINPNLPPELNNFHVFYVFFKRRRAYSERKRQSELDRDNCVKVLTEKMLEEAEKLPGLYRELAIGVDVTLDKRCCEKRRRLWQGEEHFSTPSPPTLVLIQALLSHPSTPLFGKCFQFDPPRTSFWLTKTLELTLRMSYLASWEDLSTLLHQFFSFYQSISQDTTAKPGLTPLETMHLQVAELIMQPDTIISPCAGQKPLQYAKNLAKVAVILGIVRKSEVIYEKKTEKMMKLALHTAEMTHVSKELIPLRRVFMAYFRFIRAKNTTFLHYLAKYEELTEYLRLCIEFNGNLRDVYDGKGRNCLGIAAYYANLAGLEVLLAQGCRLPKHNEGLSPFILVLEGLRYSYKPRRRQLQEIQAQESELTRRFACFKLLFSHLPSSTESVTEDLSGCDRDFAVEKEYVRGTGESRYGYAMVVAAAHYGLKEVREIRDLGLSPCLVHRYTVKTKIKVEKKEVEVTKEVTTCALKEALRRCRTDIALFLIQEIVRKYPQTLLHQKALYQDCARMARMIDLLSVSDTILGIIKSSP